MVFLVTKAALAATLVGLGVTFGALNYFARRGQENNGQQGTTENKGFGFSFNAKEPPPSFQLSSATFPSVSLPGFNLFGVPADCNCKVITECALFAVGARNSYSFRLGRTCGFQGFQRKVCCDEVQFFSTPPPNFALDEMKDVHAQIATPSCVHNHKNGDISQCTCDHSYAIYGGSSNVNTEPTRKPDDTIRFPEGRDDLTSTINPLGEETTERLGSGVAQDDEDVKNESSSTKTSESPSSSSKPKLSFPDLSEYFPDEGKGDNITSKEPLVEILHPGGEDEGRSNKIKNAFGETVDEKLTTENGPSNSSSTEKSDASSKFPSINVYFPDDVESIDRSKSVTTTTTSTPPSSASEISDGGKATTTPIEVTTSGAKETGSTYIMKVEMVTSISEGGGDKSDGKVTTAGTILEDGDVSSSTARGGLSDSQTTTPTSPPATTVGTSIMAQNVTQVPEITTVKSGLSSSSTSPYGFPDVTEDIIQGDHEGSLNLELDKSGLANYTVIHSVATEISIKEKVATIGSVIETTTIGMEKVNVSGITTESGAVSKASMMTTGETVLGSSDSPAATSDLTSTTMTSANLEGISMTTSTDISGMTKDIITTISLVEGTTTSKSASDSELPMSTMVSVVMSVGEVHSSDSDSEDMMTTTIPSSSLMTTTEYKDFPFSTSSEPSQIKESTTTESDRDRRLLSLGQKDRLLEEEVTASSSQDSSSNTLTSSSNDEVATTTEGSLSDDKSETTLPSGILTSSMVSIETTTVGSDKFGSSSNAVSTTPEMESITKAETEDTMSSMTSIPTTELPETTSVSSTIESIDETTTSKIPKSTEINTEIPSDIISNMQMTTQTSDLTSTSDNNVDRTTSGDILTKTTDTPTISVEPTTTETSSSTLTSSSNDDVAFTTEGSIFDNKSETTVPLGIITSSVASIETTTVGSDKSGSSSNAVSSKTKLESTTNAENADIMPSMTSLPTTELPETTSVSSTMESQDETTTSKIFKSTESNTETPTDISSNMQMSTTTSYPTSISNSNVDKTTSGEVVITSDSPTTPSKSTTELSSSTLNFSSNDEVATTTGGSLSDDKSETTLPSGILTSSMVSFETTTLRSDKSGSSSNAVSTTPEMESITKAETEDTMSSMTSIPTTELPETTSVSSTIENLNETTTSKIPKSTEINTEIPSDIISNMPMTTTTSDLTFSSDSNFDGTTTGEVTTTDTPTISGKPTTTEISSRSYTSTNNDEVETTTEGALYHDMRETTVKSLPSVVITSSTAPKETTTILPETTLGSDKLGLSSNAVSSKSAAESTTNAENADILTSMNSLPITELPETTSVFSTIESLDETTTSKTLKLSESNTEASSDIKSNIYMTTYTSELPSSDAVDNNVNSTTSATKDIETTSSKSTADISSSILTSSSNDQVATTTEGSLSDDKSETTLPSGILTSTMVSIETTTLRSDTSGSSSNAVSTTPEMESITKAETENTMSSMTSIPTTELPETTSVSSTIETTTGSFAFKSTESNTEIPSDIISSQQMTTTTSYPTSTSNSNVDRTTSGDAVIKTTDTQTISGKPTTTEISSSTLTSSNNDEVATTMEGPLFDDKSETTLPTGIMTSSLASIETTTVGSDKSESTKNAVSSKTEPESTTSAENADIMSSMTSLPITEVPETTSVLSTMESLDETTIDKTLNSTESNTEIPSDINSNMQMTTTQSSEKLSFSNAPHSNMEVTTSGEIVTTTYTSTTSSKLNAQTTLGTTEKQPSFMATESPINIDETTVLQISPTSDKLVETTEVPVSQGGITTEYSMNADEITTLSVEQTRIEKASTPIPTSDPTSTQMTGDGISSISYESTTKSADKLEMTTTQLRASEEIETMPPASTLESVTDGSLKDDNEITSSKPQTEMSSPSSSTISLDGETTTESSSSPGMDRHFDAIMTTSESDMEIMTSTERPTKTKTNSEVHTSTKSTTSKESNEDAQPIFHDEPASHDLSPEKEENLISTTTVKTNDGDKDVTITTPSSTETEVRGWTTTISSFLDDIAAMLNPTTAQPESNETITVLSNKRKDEEDTTTLKTTAFSMSSSEASANSITTTGPSLEKLDLTTDEGIATTLEDNVITTEVSKSTTSESQVETAESKVKMASPATEPSIDMEQTTMEIENEMTTAKETEMGQTEKIGGSSGAADLGVLSTTTSIPVTINLSTGPAEVTTTEGSDSVLNNEETRTTTAETVRSTSKTIPTTEENVTAGTLRIIEISVTTPSSTISTSSGTTAGSTTTTTKVVEDGDKVTTTMIPESVSDLVLEDDSKATTASPADLINETTVASNKMQSQVTTASSTSANPSKVDVSVEATTLEAMMTTEGVVVSQSKTEEGARSTIESKISVTTKSGSEVDSTSIAKSTLFEVEQTTMALTESISTDQSVETTISSIRSFTVGETTPVPMSSVDQTTQENMMTSTTKMQNIMDSTLVSTTANSIDKTSTAAGDITTSPNLVMSTTKLPKVEAETGTTESASIMLNGETEATTITTVDEGPTVTTPGSTSQQKSTAFATSQAEMEMTTTADKQIETSSQAADDLTTTEPETKMTTSTASLAVTDVPDIAPTTTSRSGLEEGTKGEVNNEANSMSTTPMASLLPSTSQSQFDIIDTSTSTNIPETVMRDTTAEIVVTTLSSTMTEKGATGSTEEMTTSEIIMRDAASVDNTATSTLTTVEFTTNQLSDSMTSAKITETTQKTIAEDHRDEENDLIPQKSTSETTSSTTPLSSTSQETTTERSLTEIPMTSEESLGTGTDAPVTSPIITAADSKGPVTTESVFASDDPTTTMFAPSGKEIRNEDVTPMTQIRDFLTTSTSPREVTTTEKSFEIKVDTTPAIMKDTTNSIFVSDERTSTEVITTTTEVNQGNVSSEKIATVPSTTTSEPGMETTENTLKQTTSSDLLAKTEITLELSTEAGVKKTTERFPDETTVGSVMMDSVGVAITEGNTDKPVEQVTETVSATSESGTASTSKPTTENMSMQSTDSYSILDGESLITTTSPITTESSAASSSAKETPLITTTKGIPEETTSVKTRDSSTQGETNELTTLLPTSKSTNAVADSTSEKEKIDATTSPGIEASQTPESESVTTTSSSVTTEGNAVSSSVIPSTTQNILEETTPTKLREDELAMQDNTDEQTTSRPITTTGANTVTSVASREDAIDTTTQDIMEASTTPESVKTTTSSITTEKSITPSSIKESQSMVVTTQMTSEDTTVTQSGDISRSQDEVDFTTTSAITSTDASAVSTSSKDQIDITTTESSDGGSIMTTMGSGVYSSTIKDTTSGTTTEINLEVNDISESKLKNSTLAQIETDEMTTLSPFTTTTSNVRISSGKETSPGTTTELSLEETTHSKIGDSPTTPNVMLDMTTATPSSAISGKSITESTRDSNDATTLQQADSIMTSKSSMMTESSSDASEMKSTTTELNIEGTTETKSRDVPYEIDGSTTASGMEITTGSPSILDGENLLTTMAAMTEETSAISSTTRETKLETTTDINLKVNEVAESKFKDSTSATDEMTTLSASITTTATSMVTGLNSGKETTTEIIPAKTAETSSKDSSTLKDIITEDATTTGSNFFMESSSTKGTTEEVNEATTETGMSYITETASSLKKSDESEDVTTEFPITVESTSSVRDIPSTGSPSSETFSTTVISAVKDAENGITTSSDLSNTSTPRATISNSDELTTIAGLKSSEITTESTGKTSTPAPVESETTTIFDLTAETTTVSQLPKTSTAKTMVDEEQVTSTTILSSQSSNDMEGATTSTSNDDVNENRRTTLNSLVHGTSTLPPTTTVNQEKSSSSKETTSSSTLDEATSVASSAKESSTMEISTLRPDLDEATTKDYEGTSNEGTTTSEPPAGKKESSTMTTTGKSKEIIETTANGVEMTTNDDSMITTTATSARNDRQFDTSLKGTTVSTRDEEMTTMRDNDTDMTSIFSMSDEMTTSRDQLSTTTLPTSEVVTSMKTAEMTILKLVSTTEKNDFTTSSSESDLMTTTTGIGSVDITEESSPRSTTSPSLIFNGTEQSGSNMEKTTEFGSITSTSKQLNEASLPTTLNPMMLSEVMTSSTTLAAPTTTTANMKSISGSTTPFEIIGETTTGVSREDEGISTTPELTLEDMMMVIPGPAELEPYAYPSNESTTASVIMEGTTEMDSLNNTHASYSATTEYSDLEMSSLPQMDEKVVRTSTPGNSQDQTTMLSDGGEMMWPVTEITKSIRREPDTDKTVVELVSMLSRIRTTVRKTVNAVKTASEKSISELTTEGTSTTTGSYTSPSTTEIGEKSTIPSIPREEENLQKMTTEFSVTDRDNMTMYSTTMQSEDGVTNLADDVTSTSMQNPTESDVIFIGEEVTSKSMQSTTEQDVIFMADEVTSTSMKSTTEPDVIFIAEEVTSTSMKNTTEPDVIFMEEEVTSKSMQNTTESADVIFLDNDVMTPSPNYTMESDMMYVNTSDFNEKVVFDSTTGIVPFMDNSTDVTEYRVMENVTSSTMTEPAITETTSIESIFETPITTAIPEDMKILYIQMENTTKTYNITSSGDLQSETSSYLPGQHPKSTTMTSSNDIMELDDKMMPMIGGDESLSGQTDSTTVVDVDEMTTGTPLSTTTPKLSTTISPTSLPTTTMISYTKTTSKMPMDALKSEDKIPTEINKIMDNATIDVYQTVNLEIPVQVIYDSTKESDFQTVGKMETPITTGETEKIVEIPVEKITSPSAIIPTEKAPSRISTLTSVIDDTTMNIIFEESHSTTETSTMVDIMEIASSTEIPLNSSSTVITPPDTSISFLEEIYDSLFGKSDKKLNTTASDFEASYGTTTVRTTTTLEPAFTVEVKVGPHDSRSLFSSAQTAAEKELVGEISNVVGQLLLTTHKNFHLLPSFVQCAGARGRSGRRKTRVLHFDTENYPWMARVGFKEPGGVTFPCAGTIISRRYVLTSANCATKKNNASDPSIMEILLEGARNAASGTSDQFRYKYKVDHLVVHPNYDPITRENDLALIRLSAEIPFNQSTEIKPICLPFEDGYGVWDSLPREGETAYLGGWGFGLRNMAAQIEVMEQAAVTIWSNDNCTYLYRGDRAKRITPRNLCAYGNAEKDACRGDNGGPLMALMTRQKIFFQIGIVSYGPRCGYGVPAVYTRVSPYLSWILDSMDP